MGLPTTLRSDPYAFGERAARFERALNGSYLPPVAAADSARAEVYTRGTIARTHAYAFMLATIVCLLATPASANPGTDCSYWNSLEFFAAASARTVTDCLNAGADVAARDEYGSTPLHKAAVRADNPEVLAALVSAGADVTARSNLLGLTPLHMAAARGNYATISFLLNAKADVMALDETGATPLHLAAEMNESPAVTTALLDAGSDLDARDKDGRTALHEAASSNENTAVIAVLLSAGADLDARDKDGNTALHEAASSNDNTALITQLLSAGADVEARDNSGGTPLHSAASLSHNPAVITTLLSVGAALDVRDGGGRTPLHWAVLMGSITDGKLKVVELLRAGANVNARDGAGRTPLHHASRVLAAIPNSDGASIVTTLLDAGGDPTIQDQDGKSAWDYVKDKEVLRDSDAYQRLNAERFERRPSTESTIVTQSFGNGTHIVGVDLPPGTYRSVEGSGCYWERLSGFSGEIDDVIINDNVVDGGAAVVTIKPSDKGFKSEGCGVWRMVAVE